MVRRRMWWRNARSAVLAVASFVAIGCGATAPPNDVARSEAAAAVMGGAVRESAWVMRTSMLTSRNTLAVAAQGGKIYAVGGWAQTGAGDGFTDVLEVYDVAKDTWSTRAPMPTPRNALGAAFVGGKLYAIGGWTGAGEPTGVVEAYDPTTDTWSTKSPMPRPRNSFGVADYDGRIYVVGGWLGDGPGQGSSADVDVYEPATDTWRAVEPLPAARHELAAAFLGGRLYAIGGTNPDSAFLDVVDSYDPATNSWRGEPPLLIPRRQHAAVAVEGSLVVVGGQNWDIVGPFIASVEEYVPAAARWQTRGPLGDGRTSLAAAAVGGTVYAIGGWHFTDPSGETSAAAATVEQYAYPKATIAVNGDWCVVWTVDGSDTWTTETSIVVPQAKAGPVVVTCKANVGNPTGVLQVVGSEDLPWVPCLVFNDWLPFPFDWEETIAPNGEATLVCRYP